MSTFKLFIPNPFLEGNESIKDQLFEKFNLKKQHYGNKNSNEFYR